MAEVLRSFDESIVDDSGAYRARVVGRVASDGLWEGWLEFLPIDSSTGGVLVSLIESRQPNRELIEYWASGLSVVYAEGALRRARDPVTVRVPIIDMPASDEPRAATVTLPPRVVGPEPVLDPFEVWSHRPDILPQELRALGRARLLSIIAAYDLNREGADLLRLGDPQLIRLIIAGVEAAARHQAAGVRPDSSPRERAVRRTRK